MILCVVMVMSLAPAAFAGSGTTGGEDSAYNVDRVPHYIGAGVANKAVTDLGKDIKAMYYAIAADEAVFGTAQGIYDMTNSLAKELLKDVDKYTDYVWDKTTQQYVKRTTYNEDLVDNVRMGLNHIIGNEISNYLNDHIGSFTDDDGNVKPEKYLNTFVKAVNNAFTSTKGQKNIEAIVYGLAALSTQKAVNDRADDLYDAITEWDHWDEFYWTYAKDKDGNLLGTPGHRIAANVDDPDGAYATTWLPTLGATNTVLVPTGSEATFDVDFGNQGKIEYSGDAALAGAILSGWLN